MAAKSTKAKSKRHPAIKPKVKRGKPLLARSAEVRKAKPTSRRRAATAVPVALVGNPVSGMFDTVGRVMQAYAEFPFQLAQCRTPMDLWLAQARFAQRILG